MRLRRDELDRREIGSVPRRVAGENRIAANGGMGADQEVRKHALLPPAKHAIEPERLRRRKGRCKGQPLAQERTFGKQRLDRVGIVIAIGKFGIDDLVDDANWSPDQRYQRGSRTARSTSTLVSTSVAISIAIPHDAGQIIGIDRLVAGAFQPAKRLQEPVEPLPVLDLPHTVLRNDRHHVAVKPDHDLAVRLVAGKRAKIARNGDLALGSDAHPALLTL